MGERGDGKKSPSISRSICRLFELHQILRTSIQLGFGCCCDRSDWVRASAPYDFMGCDWSVMLSLAQSGNCIMGLRLLRATFDETYIKDF